MRKALEVMRENAEKRRKELGLSYKELAEACGTTPPDINRWLKGKGTIGLDKVDTLARALKTDPARLFHSGPHSDEDCIDRVIEISRLDDKRLRALLERIYAPKDDA
jgi:transcriptional regulator with XRE-family HTH domain